MFNYNECFEVFSPVGRNLWGRGNLKLLASGMLALVYCRPIGHYYHYLLVVHPMAQYSVLPT